MFTIVRDGAVLAEGWERAVAWIPFYHVVREAGTLRSFARLPSEETAAAAARDVGGRVAEVLVQRGTGHFEIILNQVPVSRQVRA